MTWQDKIKVASGGGHKGPWRMNKSEFHFVDDPTVAIDGGGGDGDIIGTGLGPTAQGQALVPYIDVLPSYLSGAATSLDQLELPPSLLSSIRDYFDNLAEGR